MVIVINLSSMASGWFLCRNLDYLIGTSPVVFVMMTLFLVVVLGTLSNVLGCIRCRSDFFAFSIFGVLFRQHKRQPSANGIRRNLRLHLDS